MRTSALFRNVYDPAFMRKVQKTLNAFKQSMDHSMKKSICREAFVDVDEKGAAWYLGHMRSASLLLADKIKEADFVLEIRDARLPFTTENSELAKLIGSKPRLIVFNKAELANEDYNQAIHRYYERNGSFVLLTSAKRCWRDVVDVVKSFVTKCLPSQQFKSTAYVGLVVGLPNVGKSTLINSLRMAHEYQFHREDYRRSRSPEAISLTPGTTRTLKMVPVSKDPHVVLFDSPGVTLPGCFAKEAGIKLAACGIIPTNDISLPRAVVARYLYDLFVAAGAVGHWTECLALTRQPISFDDCVALVCERSGSGGMSSVGNLDPSKAHQFIMHDFQMGNLGRITLDPLPNKVLRGGRLREGEHLSISQGAGASASGEQEAPGEEITWHHVTTAEDVVDRCPEHMRSVMNKLRGANGTSRAVANRNEFDTVISRKKGPISEVGSRQDSDSGFWQHTRLFDGR